MKTQTDNTSFLRRALPVVAVFALSITSTQAATISWGLATNIAADTDVNTTGALVGAYNFGGTGVAATTVNAVTFQPFAINNTSNTYTVGNFTFKNVDTFENIASSATTLNQTLSPAYTSLLTSAVGLKADRLLTLTMANLVVGQNYLFQAWVNDSNRGYFPSIRDFTVTVDDGNGNTADVYAGDDGVGAPGNTPAFGQFVIGAFTADAVTQDVTFSQGEISGVLNGFQLRTLNTAQPPSIPDTGSTLAMLGVALAGLGLLERMGRRSPRHL
jgi:hypothetical protein